MGSWTLAPSLDQLRDEVNARWPDRDTRTDGTVGDPAHAARRSEHNPDEAGVVRAMDIDTDGIDKAEVLAAVIGEHRVHYVIHDRTIWSRTHGWKPRPYTGSNPHTGLIHISIRNNTSERTTAAVRAAAANDRSRWLAPVPAPPKLPATGDKPKTLKRGSTGPAVRKLQQGLRDVFPAYRHNVAPRGRLLRVDGILGPHTEGWVREFQRRVGIKVDGIVGADTRRHLSRFGIEL